MKRLAVIVLACAVVALTSCNNQGKKKAAEAEGAETEQVSKAEQLMVEDLKINFQALVESVGKMKKAPFLKNGSAIELTDKEKMVKPDYLIDPAATSGLVTLTQKYRAVAMLNADKVIAKLYGMPVEEIDGAIKKLVVDINDPAVKVYAESYENAEDESALLTKFMSDEYNAGRANYFWEISSAFLIEELYICTRDLDKFMPMFDDESASEVSYNFVCVHEGISQLVEFYPEMESLTTILSPLYVINAINVEQLRSQLTELKGTIEEVRASLLK